MKGSSDKAIKFFFLSHSIQLKQRRLLKSFLLNLLRKEGKKAKYINYIFCSDEYLLNINQQYLKHDFYTDIITFDLSAGSNYLEAEIYISADRIRENAGKQQVTIKNETLRVMFHGLLHLSGYKDKSHREQKEMREREEYYLNQYYQ